MSTAPAFIQQLFGSDGKTLSGGKLYSFTGGSTNLPKPLYSDKDLIIETTNPLIADGSGVLPQYFMTSGAYKFECRSDENTLLWTRDWIYGTTGTTSGSEDTFKVKTDQFDTEDYLVEKVISGEGIDVVNVTGSQRQLQINNQGKVKTNAGDTLGYLDSKVSNSDSILWGTVGNKLTATVQTSAISASIPGDRKTVVDEEDLDVPGYLSDKIAAGVGPVTVTVEQAGQHKQLHINVYDVGKTAVSENDSYDYLSKKLIAGAGITITSASDLAGEKLIINSRTNTWRPIKYVSSDYVVQDTDDTIVVRANFSSITLPTPGSVYEGRVVTVQAAGIGYGTTVVSSGTIVGVSPVVSNYSKISLICVNNNSSWIWIAS